MAGPAVSAAAGLSRALVEDELPDDKSYDSNQDQERNYCTDVKFEPFKHFASLFRRSLHLRDSSGVERRSLFVFLYKEHIYYTN